MTKLFNRLSIQNKLVTIVLLITVSALVIGFASVIMIDMRSSKQDLVNSSVIHAKLVSENIVGPMAFSDREGAMELLSRLDSVPSVVNAKIFDAQDNEFAVFNKFSAIGLKAIRYEERFDFED